jgi:hypothetical protein
VADTAGWRETFPKRELKYEGHCWIDPASFGTLAHLVPDGATTGGRGVFQEARAVCGRTIAGELRYSVGNDRACPTCVDRVRDGLLAARAG